MIMVSAGIISGSLRVVKARLVLVKLPAGGRLFEKSRRREVVDRGAAAGGGAGGRGRAGGVLVVVELLLHAHG